MNVAYMGVGVALAIAAALLASPSEQRLGGYSTRLDGRTENQRHNAVRSLEEVQGATILPGATWSFNQTVRGWSRDMGYRIAPVSYNGQLVDAWGGGVCQTSTTVYNAALQAGLEIVERHPHRFAPNYIPPGRDAAVAYEDIDLVLRNPYPFPVRLVGRVVGQQLECEWRGAGQARRPDRIEVQVKSVQTPSTFYVPGEQGRRLRNGGKAGYEVWVWRHWGDRRELVSHDVYPVMHRIVER